MSSTAKPSRAELDRLRHIPQIVRMAGEYATHPGDAYVEASDHWATRTMQWLERTWRAPARIESESDLLGVLSNMCEQGNVRMACQWVARFGLTGVQVLNAAGGALCGDNRHVPILYWLVMLPGGLGMTPVEESIRGSALVDGAVMQGNRGAAAWLMARDFTACGTGPRGTVSRGVGPLAVIYDRESGCAHGHNDLRQFDTLHWYVRHLDLNRGSFCGEDLLRGLLAVCEDDDLPEIKWYVRHFAITRRDVAAEYERQCAGVTAICHLCTRGLDAALLWFVEHLGPDRAKLLVSAGAVLQAVDTSPGLGRQLLERYALSRSTMEACRTVCEHFEAMASL